MTCRWPSRRRRGFRSLIGTLQTPLPYVPEIPPETFRSLIGTLQTDMYSRHIREGMPFRSLIGTLQTIEKIRRRSKAAQFRSLIGTLQTHGDPGHGTSGRIISIPHRYPTNDGQRGRAPGSQRISIPHRYPTNVRLPFLGIVRVQFRSLIGTLQTPIGSEVEWTSLSI